MKIKQINDRCDFKCSDCKKPCKGITHIVVLFILLNISGCICFPKNTPIQNITTTTILTNLTTTTLRPDTIYVYRNITVLEACKFKEITVIEVNQTVNVTPIQIRNIENMKPKGCYTSICSQGYFMAKYDCMDNLFLKRPKYKETPSIVNMDKRNETFYLVQNDGYTNYLIFNKSFWYIVSNEKELKIRNYYNNTRYYNISMEVLYNMENKLYRNLTPSYENCLKLKGIINNTILSWVSVYDYISGKETDVFILESSKIKDDSYINFIAPAPILNELLSHKKLEYDYVIRKYNGSYYIYNSTSNDLRIWEERNLPDLLAEFILKP